MGRKPRNTQSRFLSVRVDLQGITKEKFEHLKERYGATTNKGLIEILITEKYEELKNKEKIAELKRQIKTENEQANPTSTNQENLRTY